MIDETPEFYESVQTRMNIDVQKMASTYIDGGVDPFSFFTYLGQIAEIYSDSLKSQWEKLCADRKAFEDSADKELFEPESDEVK
jgi:hypothetical protein